MINPTSPITGGAQTGFTTPTYTITADTPPSVNGKQWAVTAIGGTQTGVDLHSVSKPFTLSVFRPAVLKSLPAASPTTGVIKSVPSNVYKIIVRKGGLPALNQAARIAQIKCEISIPTGIDTYEPEDMRAMISLLVGFLNQQSAGVGDTAVQGLL